MYFVQKFDSNCAFGIKPFSISTEDALKMHWRCIQDGTEADGLNAESALLTSIKKTKLHEIYVFSCYLFRIKHQLLGTDRPDSK